MADGTRKRVGEDSAVEMWEFTLTTADHTGAGFRAVEWDERTIEVHDGTWGGAVLQVEGSMDNTNWHLLRDDAGTVISFSSDGLKGILERVLYMRPRLTTVGTGASLTVNILTIKKAFMR